MADVRRSNQADADLTHILDHFNQTNPAVADRYARLFAERGRALARFPEMGRSRPEIAAGVRSVLVLPYVIFYRVDGDTVQILRILHGMMDLPRIMREESG